MGSRGIGSFDGVRAKIDFPFDLIAVNVGVDEGDVEGTEEGESNIFGCASNEDSADL